MTCCNYRIEALERRMLLSGTISGTVFDDLNGNGRRDAGEPGFANQTVFIDTNKNALLDSGELSQLTNATGAFSFAALQEGKLRLRHLVPTGRRITAPGSVFHDVSVLVDGSVAGLDFGNTNTAIIRGTVFSDLNTNGLRDNGEPGLAGWTVFLDKNDDGIYQPGVEKVRVTNSNGDYRFAGLTPGTYRVRVVQQLGFQLTSPISGAFTVKNLTFAQSVSNRNFAERELPDPRP